jgi:peptide-methionine (S)-S-oxide reductase
MTTKFRAHTRVSGSTAAAAAVLVLAAAVPNVATGQATESGTVAAMAPRQEVVVLSGGCFWGIQAVFEHVRGVTEAVAGYAGGAAGTAEYERVSTGLTGHAESVRVVFDPSQVSFDELLQVFFTVAHDPTQLNRQGPDDGSQYRSAVWYTTEDQERATKAFIARLTSAKTFSRPIVTQISPLSGFYPAESYHQDYAEHHPNAPYIAINDRPKVERLRTVLPNLYRDPPVLTTASASGS